ncbi:MAG: hypothetical protein QOK43_2719 [Acidimicrobiaceae bacterium]|nr:hypothetical protein [Acidimicrobiaceae bacterium]
MLAQLRRYQVKPGQMAAFLAAWRNGAAPVRGQFGFRVLAAWQSDDEAEFGWLIAYEGDGDFESAERAYYASPERAAMVDPVQYLDKVETWMVHTVDR